MSDAETLKPCPFCGEAAEYFEGPLLPGVRCGAEDCMAHVHVLGATRGEAAYGWNNRATQQPPVDGR